ncbi:hypothetical protein ACFQL0_03920 [Haloplanus litoreus]|uniref:hypothetical protein n=1 Tax=Haloplanus litoreus TaxID=767515 RepID=UPI003613EB7B
MTDDSTAPSDETDETNSQPAASDADSADGTPGGLSKRTLIRLLVGFGIGIPILIEGLTFLGLLQNQFGGEGDDSTESTATETDGAPEAVGVGDDMLPKPTGRRRSPRPFSGRRATTGGRCRSPSR